MRLKDKVGIVVGAGQTPGETIGNGRAAAVLFAREGAKVLLVDRNLQSAEETAAMITAEGGTARAIAADWTRAEDCRAFAEACVKEWGRIDFLHNNVGIGAGDGPISALSEQAYDRIMEVNLKGCLLSCRAVIDIMKAQGAGSIVNISSLAATANSQLTAYKISKAGMNALSQSLALGYAAFGVRVNTIMPGLIDTPMAIEGISSGTGIDKQKLRSDRARRVPLRGKMGSAWDVAYAGLFLHSDEAGFITGAVLPVDGGHGARIG